MEDDGAAPAQEAAAVHPDLDHLPENELRTLSKALANELTSVRRQRAAELELLESARKAIAEAAHLRQTESSLRVDVQLLLARLDNATTEAYSREVASGELRSEVQKLKAELEDSKRKVEFLTEDVGLQESSSARERRRAQAPTVSPSPGRSPQVTLVQTLAETPPLPPPPPPPPASAGKQRQRQQPPPQKPAQIWHGSSGALSGTFGRSQQSLPSSGSGGGGSTYRRRPSDSELSQGARRGGASGEKASAHRGAVRLVYISDPRADTLQQTVDFLTSELETQKAAAATAIERLQASKAASEAQFKEQLGQLEAEAKEIRRAAEEKRTAELDTSAALLTARLELADARRFAAEAEAVCAQRISTAEKAVEERNRIAAGNAENAERRAAADLQRLQAEADASAQEAAMLREQTAETKRLFQERLQNLQKRLVEARRKWSAAEARRKMDLEGLGRDVQSISAAVRRLETVTGVGKELGLKGAAAAARLLGLSEVYGRGGGGGGGGHKAAWAYRDAADAALERRQPKHIQHTSRRVQAKQHLPQQRQQEPQQQQRQQNHQQQQQLQQQEHHHHQQQQPEQEEHRLQRQPRNQQGRHFHFREDAEDAESTVGSEEEEGALERDVRELRRRVQALGRGMGLQPASPVA